MAQAQSSHTFLPVPAPFTGRQEIDLDVVRELLSHFTYSDFEEGQELILSALQEVNEHFGWVSPEAAEIVATHLGTTLTRVFGLLTFYADFRTSPRGHHHLLVCHGMSCYVLGSQQLVQGLQDSYGIADGETTGDTGLSVQVVNGCLGVCDQSPVVKIDDDYHGPVTSDMLNDLIQRTLGEPVSNHPDEESHGSRSSQ
ncbi:MAG: NAD(P)H-dependent oxidoreductase subunit E [Thermomicrobiales bacterium]